MTKFNYEEFERRVSEELDYQFGINNEVKIKGQERLKKQLLIKVDGYFQLLICYDSDKYPLPNSLDKDMRNIIDTMIQFSTEALYKPDNVPLWTGACLQFDKKSQYSGYLQCYNRQLVDKVEAEKSKYMIIMDIFDKPNLLNENSTANEVDKENNEYRCIHLILDLKDEYSLPVLFPLYEDLASKGYINYPHCLQDLESISAFYMNIILTLTRNTDRVETVNKHPKDITKDPITKIVSLYN